MNYDGYFITKDGRVYGKRGQLMSPSYNGKGYLILSLMIGGKRVTKSVHRLVAETYLPNPSNLPEVDHKNDIRDDNRLENLQWITKEKNVQKSYDTGSKSSTGTMNGRCSTEIETVVEICKLIALGMSSKDIRDLGYRYSLVRNIRRKANWKNISDLYF